MIEQAIVTLIYICVLAAAVYLVLWVISTVAGIALPEKVVQIVWIIFVLICILLLFRLLAPGFGIKLTGAMLPLLA